MELRTAAVGPAPAMRYPIDCTNAEVAWVVSWFRASMPIIVRLSGNRPVPIPNSTIHIHAPPAGATPSPTNAAAKHEQSAMITVRCLGCRTLGISLAPGMLTPVMTATIAPAVACEIPWAVMKCAISRNRCKRSRTSPRRRA